MSPDPSTTPATTRFRPATYVVTDPERPAVITSDGRVVTFAELEERSCRLAQALYAYGLREGDHVAVLMRNDDRTHEVAFGLQRSGLYYTLVNTHLTAEEAAYIVEDCGAHTLITSRALNPLAREMVALTPSIDLRLVVGEPAPATPDPATADPPGSTDYDEFVAPHPSTALEEEHEGFSMLYSSGTTGHPKGVRRALSGDDFGTSATLTPMLERIMDFKEGDVYLSPAPLYHSAPLVWSMTVQRMGGTVVVMDKFDPNRCLELIDEHKVTHAQFVPTMFVRLLKLPDEQRNAHNLTSLRSVVHAAAPCAPEVKRRMIEWWGPVIHEYYSGTEGLGMTWITSEEALAHPGSVGRAIWGEAHVCGEDGEEVPTGEDGVVYFGSRAGVTFEYNGDPEKTRQSFNDKGWATLWDIGHLDDDGFLYLTDRKQFMIVSGGVNIYPQEIEAVLVLHPAVADVAVFGVPEAEMGEEVKAVVQPAPGITPGPELEQEILAFCRDHLSHYKCPRTVDFMDQLPRGENGKLYKKPLRDAYWASSAPSTT
ncbi:MAG TPA: acyl-CoA synthetase [Acidimicrobiales bacterium]|nr:acyl-CoA synthetase [Acidimicrobiales bacterium]